MIGVTARPTLLRMALCGITYQERGKYRSTAADELAYPALRLGMENSFISRSIRTGDMPGAAPWALMALVCNQANGSVEDVWRMIEHAAPAEAAARGVADPDEFGRWPR